MKKSIKVISRKTLSSVLAIAIILSTLGIGSILTATAYDALNIYGYIYAVKPSDWTYMSFLAGRNHDNYHSTAYDMTNISGTNLYYVKVATSNYSASNSTEYASQYAFIDANGWGGQYESVNQRYTGASHYSAIETSYDLNDGKTYYITLGSSNDAAFTKNYYSGGYSAMNKTLTVKTMLFNGSSYVETTTNCGTFSDTDAKKISGNGTSSDSDFSLSNGVGTLETAITNTASVSQSAASGYQFMGWKESSDSTGTSLSAGSYSFSNTGSNKTIYAYYKRTYTINFSQPTNGSINYNNSTTSPITVLHGDSVSLVVTPNSDYRIKSLTDGSTAVSAAVGKTSAYTYTISSVSANHTVTAVMELNRTALDQPSITLNGQTSNQTVNAKRNEKITLAWAAVSNAAFYEIYKDNVSVATTTELSYSIEKGSSYSGSYTVVAKVNSGDPTYANSTASNAISLTVNKVALAAPTITQSATEVYAGQTVTFTYADTNSSNYVPGTDYKYQHSGENNSTYADFSESSWTTGELNNGGTITFTFKTLSLQDDYYTSATVSKTVYVSKPKYYLTGDLVYTTDNDASNWSTTTAFPLDTFSSKDVFYATVTVRGGAANANHYFRLTNGSDTQYKATDSGDVSMATYNSSSSMLTLNKTGTNGAMYVTGNGTYKIYVDQSGTNPKIWVTNLEWSLTATAYYKSYNLVEDHYNSVLIDTDGIGGTVSPAAVEVIKTQATTLTATPASGYQFVGWYTDTDFADSHKVSNAGATWNFTPTESMDYYALFRQTEPARRTITVSNTYNAYVTVTATYNSTTHAAGTSFDVPHGATVTVSYTLGTGCELIGSSNPITPALDANNQFTATADTTVSVPAKMIDYTLTGVAHPNHGTVTFYSNSDYVPAHLISGNAPTAHYGQTIYVLYTPPQNESYEVKEFLLGGATASVTQNSQDYNKASFTMPAANVTITAEVLLQHTVKYFIDMHGFETSEVEGNAKAVRIDIVDSNGTVRKDARGHDCTVLAATREQSSTVYSAPVPTPLVENNGVYDSIYVQITYNGKSDTRCLVSTHVAAMVQSNEVWMEAVNETSQFKLGRSQTVTQSYSAPCANQRRIYLVKPASMVPATGSSTKDKWKEIGIYYWGTTIDNSSISWTQGIHLTYLGYGETNGAGYYYYYVDIPKPAENEKSNFIFQGWEDKTTITSSTDIKAQTADIKDIADFSTSSACFMLKVDSTVSAGYNVTAMDGVVFPSHEAGYVNSAWLNTGATAKIAPTYNGAVRYASSNPAKVTVSADGTITAVASTIDYSGGTPVDRPVTITVYVLSTAGILVTNTTDGLMDGYSYTVSVSVHDPGHFQGFNVMALASQEFTVAVPAVGADQPGYFDLANCTFTVTGMQGAASSTSSAIVKENPVYNGKTISFTVKYAKADATLNLMRDAAEQLAYDNISITGTIVTESFHNTANGARYGFERWEEDGTTVSGVRVEQMIEQVDTYSIETATTYDLPFNAAKHTYNAIFSQYAYVDVTFTYQYQEYVPKTVDGMIEYPYDITWAADQNAHRTVSYVVSNYEVRGKTADGGVVNGQATTAIAGGNLVTDAVKAIKVMPENNYYSYSISATDIVINSTDGAHYTAAVTVNLQKTVKHYSVYVNGTGYNFTDAQNVSTAYNQYTYQQEVKATAEGSGLGWYAVDDQTITTPADNDPLLATGSNYTFRVKGDTYLRTVPNTVVAENEFNRSEVEFSHYEVSHKDITDDSVNNPKEYLMQNFYIADFFDPTVVKRSDTNTPEDNVTFVGGGVVYYSVTSESVTEDGNETVLYHPNGNTVNMGYTNEETGTINQNAVKAVLTSVIEQEYKDHDGIGDAAGAANRVAELGEDDAMKVAYGTEIAAQQYLVPGTNEKTGLIIRYLPLYTYDRENGDIKKRHDAESDKDYYTLERTLNNNVYRYSNSLKSYQYVYASGNENKVTNNGRDMRVYAYYIYSYTAYDVDTNVPKTKYVIVMSNDYSDASTYWAGNGNNTN